LLFYLLYIAESDVFLKNGPDAQRISARKTVDKQPYNSYHLYETQTRLGASGSAMPFIHIKSLPFDRAEKTDSPRSLSILALAGRL
jgi:hypothetical protein